MLDNYKKLENGVIKQIKKHSLINYNYDYVNNSYNTYGESGLRMAHLRVGYLIGSLGFAPNSVLDIGYGNGDFLKICSSIIKNCYGHDISGYPLPDHVTFVENPYENEYDIVTFFDVLEHFDDIYDIKNLKTNYILISLPYCHYYSDEWFEAWKHRRPNEHLWHFDKNSLISFMNEIGYNCINICNIEDTIRKDKLNSPNILTGIFKKKIINEKTS
jgi:hypothetical protein